MTAPFVRLSRVLTLAAIVLVACTPERRGDDVDPIDAGTDAGFDAGPIDGGPIDAGPRDGGSVDAGCGSVTPAGECRGNDAIWCDDGALASMPCENAANTGAHAVCTIAGAFGSWCAVDLGQRCAYDAPSGQGLTIFVCGDRSGPRNTQGCDVDDGCTSGAAACQPVAPGQNFVSSCRGSRLVFGCTAWGQPITQDCTGSVIGATGCTSGACTGIASGRPCDELHRCQTGFACTNDVCTAATAATLLVTVTGQGTVTSTPPAISCPGACAATGDPGEQISLTAAAATGWAFQAWGGSCSGTAATIPLTLSGARTCSATFIQNNPTLRELTVYTPVGGRVASAPAGIACPGDCSEFYPVGTQVTLTATPDANYRFKTWESCSTSMGSIITVTLPVAYSCRAVFEETRPLTVTVIGPGRVTSAPLGIDCPGTCSAPMPVRSVTLTEVPSTGARFKSWSGMCSGTGPSTTFTLSTTQGNACTATFEAIPTFALSIAIAGQGTVVSETPGIACPGDCSENYLQQTLIRLTATAGPNHRFVRWTGDCDPGTATTATTTAFMDRARSCRAEFAPLTTATMAWRHAGPSRYGGKVVWNSAGTRFAVFEQKSFRYFDAVVGTFLGASTEITTTSIFDSITALAWNPGGTVVAAAVRSDNSYRIHLRNLATGSSTWLPATGVSHTQAINAIAWSPDGTRLASASSDTTIKIWDTVTGAQLRNWTGSAGGVSALNWSPDGTRLATLGSEGVRIWSAATPFAQEQAIGGDFRGEVHWSHDSTRVTASDGNSTIYVWNVSSGAVEKSWVANGFAEPSFDVSGQRVETKSSNQVRVWNIATATVLFTAPAIASLYVRDAEWSPTGPSIAVSYSDGSVRLVDGTTGAISRVFQGPSGEVRSIALNHARNEIYASSVDGLVYAVNASTGAYARDLGDTRFGSSVRSLSLSPAGTELAGAVGSDVYVWATADGVRNRNWGAGTTIEQLKWSALNVLATTSLYGTSIKLWPASGGAASSTATLVGQSSAKVDWHPAGGLLASTGARTVLLWNTEAGVQQSSLTCAGNGYAYAGAFSPDGSRLAGACSTGLMTWGTATGTWGSAEPVVATPLTTTEVLHLAWRPDGNVIAGVKANTLQLWEAATGNALLQQPITPDGSVTALAWSADGSRIFASSSAGTITAYAIAP